MFVKKHGSIFYTLTSRKVYANSHSFIISKKLYFITDKCLKIIIRNSFKLIHQDLYLPI